MQMLLAQGAVAFAAGLLLNFTPCVLPVIPLKVRALLAGIEGNSRARGLAALALLAGSLAFFLPLGLLSTWLGWQWGALFQSRGFLILLVALLLAAGTATLCDWGPRLPQWTYHTPTRRFLGTYGGAFFAGLLSGVLATPCAGPFLGGVLAFSLTQPAAVVMTLFALIGLGLVFPYLLLLCFPGLLRRLPQNGLLGKQVKTVLGFVLIGGAIFFSKPLLPDGWHPWLWRALALAVTLWAIRDLWRCKGLAARLVPGLAIALLLVSAVPLLFWRNPAQTLWQPYRDNALAAARAQRRPVLLEFTADWCLNCKVLEKTVYADPRLGEFAGRNNLVLLQVDLTDFNEGHRQLLERHCGRPLPYAVVVDRNGRRLKSFSGLFSIEALLAALAEAAAERPNAAAGAAVSDSCGISSNGV